MEWIYPTTWDNQNTQQNMWSVVLGLWTSGSGGQWSVREGKRMRRILQWPQLTAWTELPGCSAGRGTQVEPDSQSGLKTELEVKVPRIHRLKESCAERDFWKLQRVFLGSSVEYWSALACEETMGVWGKNSQKNRGEHLQGSHRARNSMYSTSQIKGGKKKECLLWCSGLRIRHCCSGGIGHSYSSDLIPGLETSLCCNVSKKEKKKKGLQFMRQ